MPRSQRVLLRPPAVAHSGPRHAAQTQSWRLVSTPPAAAPLPRVPPTSWSAAAARPWPSGSGGREPPPPSSSWGQTCCCFPLCRPRPGGRVGAAGGGPGRASAAGSAPGARWRGEGIGWEGAAGPGRGGEEEARARGPAQRGLSGRGERGGSCAGSPRAAEWAECCEGRGRRGGALPGPRRGEVRPLLGRERRGRGVGGTRRLGLGTRLLAHKMLIRIPARPSLLSGGANPSGSARHSGPIQRPGRAHAATPSLAPLLGIPFASGRIQRPLLREALPYFSRVCLPRAGAPRFPASPGTGLAPRDCLAN